MHPADSEFSGHLANASQPWVLLSVVLFCNRFFHDGRVLARLLRFCQGAFFSAVVLVVWIMPRKTLLPDDELRICQRVAYIRNKHNLSREDWSRVSGMTAGRIARIEWGRTFFLYEDFLQLMPWLLGGPNSLASMRPINPLWLCDGKEPTRLEWPLLLPSTEFLGIRFNIGFKDFVEENRTILTALIYDRDRCVLPPKWLMPYFKHGSWLKAKSEQIDQYCDIVEDIEQRSVEAAPDDCQEKIEAASARSARDLHKELQKKGLTVSSLKGNRGGVMSEIEKLISKVKSKAAKPGAKADLARELNVDPARISEWLSGKKEPGGEYTLRLLCWVEQS